MAALALTEQTEIDRSRPQADAIRCRAGMRKRSQPAGSWVSLSVAASLLGFSTEALRKQLDRRAKRVPDGGIEAELDSIRARKLGRLWRVQLSAAWMPEGPS